MTIIKSLETQCMGCIGSIITLQQNIKNLYIKGAKLNIVATLGLIWSIHTIQKNIELQKKQFNNRPLNKFLPVYRIKEFIKNYVVTVTGVISFWYAFCNPNFEGLGLWHGIKDAARENKTCSFLSSLVILSLQLILLLMNLLLTNMI